MDFTFTTEQEELREAVRSFLRRSESPSWTVLTGQLGLTALAVAEEHGGFGASLVEVAVAVEELGAALSPLPYLSTVAAAAALDPSLPAAAKLLPDLAAGTLTATLALSTTVTATRDGDRYRLHGSVDHVLDGDRADVVVVAAGDGLFAVRETATVLSTLDQTRGQARFSFGGTPADRVGDAAGAADLLRALIAVESVGVARASLAITTEHLNTREQFGAPLATFQALRHRVADLAVRLEAATSSAWYAIRVAGTPEFAVAAPLAKLVATEAAYAVTAGGIQLLGGIGFTWEHPAHRYFKRATANRLLAGDPVTLRRLVGQRAGLT